ncbi:MAG: DUF4248 domain-containing protein [Tannerellaceae bacterium]|nr:DUF4248 domain-containing protein [Tannerellaceae bacterium]
MKEEKTDFVIKAYGLQELALLYFPSNTPGSAAGQLKKWLTVNKKLMAELEQADYYSGQRLFTPRQIAIIIEHLGPP